MTKKSLILLLAIFILLSSCEKGSDQSESMPMRYWMTSGGEIFSVDGFGTANALDFNSMVLDADTSGMMLEEIVRKEMFLDTSLEVMYLLTADNKITRINLIPGSTLNEILVYQFGDTVSMGSTVVSNFVDNGILDARFGYSGQRLYVLGETSGRGVVLDELDFFGFFQKQIAGPLQDLGPGMDKPAAFDIAVGGTQAWVLYESGKLMAFNLFDVQEQEGEIAEFGPGAKDVQILKNNTVFVAGANGLYRFFPSITNALPQLITDVGPLKICRADSQRAKEVWAISTSDEIYLIQAETGLVSMNVQPPFPVSSVLPKNQYWVKNTKPFIEEPYFIVGIQRGNTGFTLIDNPNYNTYYTDIEGETAKITATFVDAPAGVVFTDSGDTVVSYDFPPGINTPLSFCGGYTPGQVDIRIEAESENGLVSTLFTSFDLVDPNPVPPAITWCVPPP
jgi:hypothetical protein